MLSACRTLGALPSGVKELLWEQDLADGFLNKGDKVGFEAAPISGSPDQAEDVVVLKVSGEGACR